MQTSQQPAAIKDAPHRSSKGVQSAPEIEGARVFHEPHAIVTGHSLTSVLFRASWEGCPFLPKQVLFVALRPREVSAWHRHDQQYDYVACCQGALRVVLYDDREDSPTRGTLQEHLVGGGNPTGLAIPPGVWHGIQNLDSSTSSFVNLFDREYNHENPDEWRLPPENDLIPFTFPLAP
jgi:dTDP-4-dehydrorhamnose 3,5-epimerase